MIIGMLVCPGFCFSQQADSIKKLPPLNKPRTSKIDTKHIVLDLRFDWIKRQAYGTATISLRILENTNEIALDAGMLTVNSIKLLNEKSLDFKYDGRDKDNGLSVMLDRLYKPNEEITIKIDYHTNWVNETDPNNLGGSNGKGIRFFSPTQNEPKRRKQAWSMGEPVSNRYWFPCHDDVSDIRTTELIATVSKELMAISNGNLIDTRTNNDGTKTYHWKTNIPYQNHKTSFVIGEYVDISQKYANTALHSFGYPDEADAVKATVDRLPDMVTFFSEYTGMPYPYPTYSQIFVQEAPWGIGYNAVSTHSENMIDDYRTHADYLYLWDGLEAEGLAQQWFGNAIMIKDWSELWLSRAFAHYFDGLYTEYKNGHDEFQLWYRLVGDEATFFADWNSGNRRPVVTNHYADLNTMASDNYSYIRGGMVLHMLRKYLGEEKWKQVIKYYVKANAGKMVSTQDFQHAVENIAGTSMQWFFDQWIYKMGYPVFEISKNYNEAKKQLTLIVKQTQQVDTKDKYPQQDFFKGNVTIEIDDKMETVWLDAKAENHFRFNLPQKPKLVSFDYGSTWIKEMRFKKETDELIYQLLHDKDVRGKRWALDQLASTAADEKTLPAEKEKIIHALCVAAEGNTYWRFRMAVIWQLQNVMTASTGSKPAILDEKIRTMLVRVIRNNPAWVRTWAINFLGATRDEKYADLYIEYLNDSSERVINAAAIALGKTKSQKTFDVLIKLKDKPSWKNQSLISTLYGLKELGDPRGFKMAFDALSDITSPRWTLAVPVWDYRIAAANTIASLGRSDTAYPMIFDRFKRAMDLHDVNDIFSNILLITSLADERGKEAFTLLRERFKDDENAMIAVNQYETQFNNAIKKK